MKEFDSKETSQLLAKIFEWLDSANIKYCVERNYSGYPELITGDIDLIVLDDQIIEAAKGISMVAKEIGWFCYQGHTWSKSVYLGFCKSIFPHRFALTVELFSGARWHGVPYLAASAVIDQRLRSGITWRPRSSHQAVITSVHHLLYNGNVPIKYRNEIHNLVSEDSESFYKILKCSFGRKLASTLNSRILATEWDSLENHILAMKIRLIERNLIMNPLTTIINTYRGCRAKRRLPEGVILIVNAKDTDERYSFCQALLELADRWHLFIPPIRKILDNDSKYSRKAILKAALKIVNSGGVAILNGSTISRELTQLSFPQYHINIHDNQWALSLDNLNTSKNDELISSTIETIELAAAQVWNNILADRVVRRTRLAGSDV